MPLMLPRIRESALVPILFFDKTARFIEKGLSQIACLYAAVGGDPQIAPSNNAPCR